MLYLYALLSREPREYPGIGIRGESLCVLPSGNLFAVVSEMTGVPPLQEWSIRGHERTVRRLAESVEAILPARFGSVMPDEHALVKLVESREAELRQALALVEGREQMTLRVYGEGHPARKTAVEEVEALGPGARYLARKMRASEREQVIAELEAVRPELAPFVRAERIQRHSTPPLLASVYHLIERGQSTRYIAALEGGARGDPPVRFTASGPWPPYAFARWEWL